MEKKLLNPYDKHCMRMAMLKHEETFKQQVYELHRLYQVQKMLMKSMETNNKGNNVISNGGHNNNNIEIMDESEIELTLGPSCNKKKKKMNSSPEIMDGDLNSGRRSLSSSSTGSSNNNNLEEQMRLMKHQKQKQQPWLQALTLNVI